MANSTPTSLLESTNKWRLNIDEARINGVLYRTRTVDNVRSSRNLIEFRVNDHESLTCQIFMMTQKPLCLQIILMFLLWQNLQGNWRQLNSELDEFYRQLEASRLTLNLFKNGIYDYWLLSQSSLEQQRLGNQNWQGEM